MLVPFKTILLVALLALSSNCQDVEEDFIDDIYDETPQYQDTQSAEQPTAQQVPTAQTKKQEKVIIDSSIKAASKDPMEIFLSFFTVEKLTTFRNELMGLAGILMYIAFYIRGKRANAQLIDNFYQETHDYINDNFAHIGFTKQSNEQPFIGQSASEVLFYATGRNNVESMDIKFNLRKRQDLISIWGFEFIWPEKDQIIIDIPVKTEIPLVFLLSLKKKLRTYIQQNIDISMLTGTFQMKGLHRNYQTLGESVDTLDQVFDSKTIKKISDTQGLFMQIHYTDQKTFSESSGHLRVILNGAYKDTSKYLQALEIVFKIADKIATMKLSQNLKAKALQSRDYFNASKEKANLEARREEMRKKKEQKLRKQEAWLRSLPPEKQKKEDQKKKRKEMNKMMMKGKM